MFEVQLPGLKKFQNVAGDRCRNRVYTWHTDSRRRLFSCLDWHCPFGEGILRSRQFFGNCMGFGSAIVFR